MTNPGKTAGNWLRRAGQFLVFLLFLAIEKVLGVLSLDTVARFGAFVGNVAWIFGGKHRALAINNLRIAFGREMTEAQIRDIARRHFISLGRNLICGFKLPLMTEKEIIKRVKIEGIEHIAAVVAQGKSLLFAVFHMSCWELLTQVPSIFAFGKKPGSIYQPLANPFLNARVLRNREKLGYRLFDRSQGFAEPVKFVRARDTTLGVLVDQHAGDSGVWCPFFDRLASTTSLPALMSLRCDTPLLPLIVYDDGPGRWKLVCFPPVESGEEKPTADGITAELNIVAEQIIRRAPENWFWVHNRWKTPQPDFLLANYKRGIKLPRHYEARALQPFDLLVRSPNWLGDACMTFPAVRALKAGRPDLRLTILAPAKLRDLWTSLPEVDHIIGKEYDDKLTDVARRIRETGTRFDAAILFTNSTRSTIEIWLARIPRLIGYRGSLRAKLLHQITTEPPAGSKPRHHAKRYLHLAAHCGAKTADPALFVTGGPAETDDGITRIGICAGAEYGPAKRWPLERFAETANSISITRPDIEWQLLGAPGEKEMGEKLSALLPCRHTNLVGKTNLTELIATLRRCRALLTNDTGTMHLAAALGIPTVSIFGSTEPILTGPVGARHIVIRHHVACSPCFKRECPFEHYDCMTGVMPEQVARAVLTVV